MIHVVNLALGVALLVGTAVAWPDLPAEIPVHLGLSGPDRWAETTPAGWFGPPLVAVALVAVLYALGRLLPSRPGWINLPHKHRYLALGPEERRPVDEALRAIFHWMGTFVLVLFVLVQVMVHRQAHGQGSADFLVLVLVVTLTGGPAVAVVGLVRMHAALDAAWRRHRAGRPPSDPASPA